MPQDARGYTARAEGASDVDIIAGLERKAPQAADRSLRSSGASENERIRPGIRFHFNYRRLSPGAGTPCLSLCHVPTGKSRLIGAVFWGVRLKHT
jgi:hypothetical protein